MRRLATVALSAILLLAAASIVLIAFATREAPGSRAGPQPAGSVDPPAPEPPPPAGGRVDVPTAGGLPELPPPPVIRDDPPPVPPAGTWEAVAVVARPAALGPVGAAIGRELNELEPELSACFDEVTQARYGREAYTRVRDHARSDDHGTPTLMLEVETLQGSVRIVDAPVETRGGASDGLIACAQQVLRGREIPIPQARAGARHRILFPLQQ